MVLSLLTDGFFGTPSQKKCSDHVFFFFNGKKSSFVSEHLFFVVGIIFSSTWKKDPLPTRRRPRN